jgi:hypothetical protein
MNLRYLTLAVVSSLAWGCRSHSLRAGKDAAVGDLVAASDRSAAGDQGAGDVATERAGDSVQPASVIGGTAGNVYGGICPGSPPPDGTSCGTVPGFCQYGDDPRLQFCLTNAACTPSGGWQVTPPQASCSPAPDPGPCPASADSARDKPCSVEGSFCVYESTPCGCTACGLPGSFAEGHCPGTLTWHCAGPYRGADSRCPPYLRNLGTVCDIEDASCCLGCLCYTCSSGVWTGPPPPTRCGL